MGTVNFALSPATDLYLLAFSAKPRRHDEISIWLHFTLLRLIVSACARAADKNYSEAIRQILVNKLR